MVCRPFIREVTCGWEGVWRILYVWKCLQYEIFHELPAELTFCVFIFRNVRMIGYLYSICTNSIIINVYIAESARRWED